MRIIAILPIVTFFIEKSCVGFAKFKANRVGFYRVKLIYSTAKFYFKSYYSNKHC